MSRRMPFGAILGGLAGVLMLATQAQAQGYAGSFGIPPTFPFAFEVDIPLTSVPPTPGWDGTSLIKWQRGSLVLSATNTFIGRVFIDNGVLALASQRGSTIDNFILTSSGVEIALGGRFDISYALYGARIQTLNETSERYNPNNVNFPPPDFSGIGSSLNYNLHDNQRIVALGNSKLTVLNGGYFSGVIQDAGFLQRTEDAAGYNYFPQGGAGVPMEITTGGILAVAGGTLILSGANTYSGGTEVDAGTLQAGAVGTFSPNAVVTIASAGVLNLAGFTQTVPGVNNAGLIQLSATPTSIPGTNLIINGDYLGEPGSRIMFNTVFGDDSSLTDKLVINGGNASGNTVLSFTNVGGAGAQTNNGILVVETTNGGTTTPTAFTMDGGRYPVGAFEYQLVRKGENWYLTAGGNFREETPLYGPISAMGRSLGLFTVRTLHERVGDEENLRRQPENRSLLNGLWARALGEHQTNSFTGAGDASVDGNLWGVQAGLDLYRHTTDSGHRNHFGALGSYSSFSADGVRGNVLGEMDVAVGALELKGFSAGLYWTHFGPGGWYLDAVTQGSWFDVKATSRSGSHLDTNMDGITASLETGYPIRVGTNGMWMVEPQAQLIWQGFSVDDTHDELSEGIAWNTADAWTGRLGVRIQQSCKCAEGPLWQRYGRLNLWHDFNGADGIMFDGNDPVDTRFGGTSLEGGLGMTAKASRLLSVYGEAAYRHSVGGVRRESSGVHGTLGLRLNW
ncbi:MAG: autotransporter outer membrane beta-barrel domain-containing protein [Gemmatimonadota bacterium]|jgi:outer membrane autotransporter protein|nr:autotransporter outer membrane beta-barrel domain-containing protein [Gemmatimonadota bacterium]